MKTPLLIKFQQSSVRVKGVSFHPQRPWLLSSLHDGLIQIWDYRSEVLVDKFEGHVGPVRSVHFHPSQPLFVSGGDDGVVKVWNYQQRVCLFSLEGHSDYVRSVMFHPTYPWIVSCSDDQTVRIWNWQNRSSVAVLTGHTYYVFSARFHPTQDLIVSASLDCTVRVWDISGLVKKHLSISTPSAVPPGGMKFGLSPHANDDLFHMDVVVRHVLEGHTKGVNYADFHPTLPLIVSGGDDNSVCVWRHNDSKAWLIDTLHGHSRNVSCVKFHPERDVIISNSEDKSLRVWDVTRTSVPTVLCRENDRFWMLDVHPHNGLIAAGHDGGMFVFKLHRERPAHTVVNGVIYFFKDGHIHAHNPNNETSLPLFATKRPHNTAATVMRTLQMVSNTTTNTQTFLTQSSDGVAECYVYDTSSSQLVSTSSSQCRVAWIMSSSRFIALDKNKQVLIKTFSDETKRKLSFTSLANAPVTVVGVYPSPSATRVLVRSLDSVMLYDVNANRAVAELRVSPRHVVKYVTWSPCGSVVVIQTKSTMYVCDASLSLLCQVTESVRIKSVLFDLVTPATASLTPPHAHTPPTSSSSGVVIVYSTHSHIKYCLLNGETGVIMSIDDSHYLASISPVISTPDAICKDLNVLDASSKKQQLLRQQQLQTQTPALLRRIVWLDRTQRVLSAVINPVEYLFKLAVLNGDVDQVAAYMASGFVVGKHLLDHIASHDLPLLALQYLADPTDRFALAIAAGDLNTAKEAAMALDDPAVWLQLGLCALDLGDCGVAEVAMVKGRGLAQLFFHYLASDNPAKRQRLLKICRDKLDRLASESSPSASRDSGEVLGELLHMSLVDLNVENVVRVLISLKQFPLAYLFAHNYVQSGQNEPSIMESVVEAINNANNSLMTLNTANSRETQAHELIDLQSCAPFLLNNQTVLALTSHSHSPSVSHAPSQSNLLPSFDQVMGLTQDPSALAAPSPFLPLCSISAHVPPETEADALLAQSDHWTYNVVAKHKTTKHHSAANSLGMGVGVGNVLSVLDDVADEETTQGVDESFFEMDGLHVEEETKADSGDAGLGEAVDDDFDFGDLDLDVEAGSDDVSVDPNNPNVDSSVSLLPEASPSVLALLLQSLPHSSSLTTNAVNGQMRQILSILQSQFGIVNFAPLKRFVTLIATLNAAHTPTLPSLPPLSLPLVAVKTPLPPYNSPISAFDFASHCIAHPSLPFSLSSAQSQKTDLEALMLKGQLQQALNGYTTLLHSLLFLNPADSPPEEVSALKTYCVGYISLILLEQHRATIKPPPTPSSAPSQESPAEIRARAEATAEITALMTMPSLPPTQSVLQLWVACKYMFQLKNFSTVGVLCRRILPLLSLSDQATLTSKNISLALVNKMIRKCDSENSNAVSLSFPANANPRELTVCVASRSLISDAPYLLDREVCACVFCGAKAKIDFVQQTCPVCSIGKLGGKISN